MKVSVVTISFNQAEFLERAIQSVLSQEGVELEYIVTDPGSTDGSRDIIEKYRNDLARVIFEKDDGPADGLNKGFSYATGDILCYLNSDDTLLPDALSKAVRYFEENEDVDVICGHCHAIDRADVPLRRVWSEPFSRMAVAYGVAIQIQPSTFFRRRAFLKTRGFNPKNRSNWDGELLADLFLSGAKILVIDEFLSCYRLHGESITNSGSHEARIRDFGVRRFEMLMGRPPSRFDGLIRSGLRVWKHVAHPYSFLERLRFGPLYRRGVN